jgi:hypothetical protein
MNIVDFSEQEVEITAVYFRAERGQTSVASFPRRMMLDGREYTFSRDSWRYQVQKGQELVQLFDVSDGQSRYRLRLGPTKHWTLVNIKSMKIKNND